MQQNPGFKILKSTEVLEHQQGTERKEAKNIDNPQRKQSLVEKKKQNKNGKSQSILSAHVCP